MPWFPTTECRRLDDAARELLGGDYVRLSAGHTYYVDEGPRDGPIVVMLHGATLPSWCFDAMAPALTEAGYRVLRFDGYGRGRSDRPVCAHDMELFVQQTREFLDALAIERCHLVAFSLGAAVSAYFAERHPERVERHVLMAPVVDYGQQSRTIALACHPTIGPMVSATIGLKRVVDRAETLFGSHGRADRFRSKLAEQISLMGFQRSMRSIMEHCVLRDHSPVYERLGRHEKSVLVLWGDQDAEISRLQVDTVVRGLPNSRLIALQGMGHGLAMQGPRRCSRAVLEFLDEGADRREEAANQGGTTIARLARNAR